LMREGKRRTRPNASNREKTRSRKPSSGEGASAALRGTGEISGVTAGGGQEVNALTNPKKSNGVRGTGGERGGRPACELALFGAKEQGEICRKRNMT